MPELPEVERGRKIAAAVAKGQKIIKVWVDDDPIVFDKLKPSEVKQALLHRRVQEVHRHGKQLWFELDKRPWPLFHFGMTGGFQTGTSDVFSLETGPKSPKDVWPPRFTKIHLCFENGQELVMTNARRFGRILFRENPQSEPPLNKLGFDPYFGLPSKTEFSVLVSKRKTTIKALLLNQQFAAGVGNWIADEILYQAKIAPSRRACGLTNDELSRLHKKLGSVIKKAVDVNAEKHRFPKSWLFHHRWGQVKNARTAKGEIVQFDTVAGRTTAWVPSVQR